jgi:hypothetical protein
MVGFNGIEEAPAEPFPNLQFSTNRKPLWGIISILFRIKDCLDGSKRLTGIKKCLLRGIFLIVKLSSNPVLSRLSAKTVV